MTELGGYDAADAASVYFDGASNRRRRVSLALAESLEMTEQGAASVQWAYADIRQVDGAPGILRLSCVSAPPLARLEIRDAALASAVAARCSHLRGGDAGAHGTAKIVGWSLAAAASIIALVVFVIPLVADWLTPMVPAAFERRLGEAAELQIETVFGDQTCKSEAGQQAFVKLVNALREASSLDGEVTATVLDSKIPNAFALPGGKIYLLNGLLAKAENPDEIAGVLAHELGHDKHRDGIRELIHNGGTSFLIGLLFGDVTGSGAAIFSARALLTASYSRDAEQGADTVAIEVMRKLGRSPKPMGELLFRVTGKEGDKGVTILASHPLSEDRLKRMSEEDRPASGPPLLSAEEWTALKAICAK